MLLEKKCLVDLLKMCYNTSSMAKFTLKYPRVAHVGNKVSHAKNRSKRGFKYNLHNVTVIIDGVKQRMRVPTKVLRQLKKQGLTTHWKKPASDDK